MHAKNTKLKYLEKFKALQKKKNTQSVRRVEISTIREVFVSAANYSRISAVWAQFKIKRYIN